MSTAEQKPKFFIASEAMIEEILNRLFTNGAGETAERLVLELENGRDGGGWCRGAVRDQIRDALQLKCTANKKPPDGKWVSRYI